MKSLFSTFQRIYPKLKVKIFLYFLFFCFLIFFLDFLLPFRPSVQWSPMVYSQEGYVLQAYLSQDQKWRVPLEINKIPKDVEQLILYKEDRWFYWHIGVNPIALARAFFSNLSSRKRNSGASTITMQVVRRFTGYQRTYLAKGIEILRAFQLEWHYSKKEILWLYLNYLPYGGNIEGIETAAQLYFGQSCQNLSPARLVSLVIIPNRPTTLSIQKNEESIHQARNFWLNKFHRLGLISKSDLASALAEPIELKRHTYPEIAPHWARFLRKQYPDNHNIKSTIQLSIQNHCQRVVTEYMKSKQHIGVTQAAVLVLDNSTGAVCAYIGSQDFFDISTQGEVDGIQAVRSPGSTLKPLIYGLAYDNGSITPKTILYDVPIHIAGYEPENYDMLFRGKVTAEEALAQSLNIPAVKLLQQYGLKKFIDRLAEWGLENMEKDKDKLGLSLVLGGSGASLWELSRMYLAFANHGQWQDIQTVFPLSKPVFRTILSPEATFLIHQNLVQLTRPDFPNHFEETKNSVEIAWKTGTSYGRRDAWAIGYTGNYTVGVWVGNFDGTGVSELTGAQMATPLLFKIFNTLGTLQSYSTPKTAIQTRMVCQETGKIPSAMCKQLSTDFYIPLVSDPTPCEHLKKIWVNLSHTMSYCAVCVPSENVIEEWYPYYPKELTRLWSQQKKSYTQVPMHNPACGRILQEQKIEIISPHHQSEYFIDRLNKKKIALEAQVPNDVTVLNWFVNDRFIAKVPPQETVFFLPDSGFSYISVTDNKGRQSKIQIQVSYF